MGKRVYILGGAQTDFARNWAREGLGLYDLMAEGVQSALVASGVDAASIEVAHIGNFAAELFAGQGNLGGFLSYIDTDLTGIPASRHEGACASGSLAVLGAMSDLEAGRYDMALVCGLELMRNVSGQVASDHLGAAAWVGQETDGRQYVWPSIFSDMADAYERLYGLDRRHLAAISEKNFSNARQNPLAQTRSWQFAEGAFGADDELNPVVAGHMRRTDCGQVTDGAAVLILASESAAQAWADRHGKSLDDIPFIAGWGHSSAPMMLSTKIPDVPTGEYLFPLLRRAITDAYRRADISGPMDLDGIELHDCFSITEYMLIEHFGITKPGEAWRAIEDGLTEKTGSLPVNVSGGLIGAGHPVGASGVRMMLDAAQQVSGTAGDCQIEGARSMGIFNIGGSGVTNCAFVVRC